ncbi:hypothetical protein [Burkholderia anthina]|uniref:hypothetical protein n=1 Tax=Burkholderia anthina TaxID=179879 RepID=UPI001AA06D2B|nr:hypothetical protein [Burkholderia anthina]QTD88780.1 hypothetical protein J4G50_13240 [Burkholderia anthina]
MQIRARGDYSEAFRRACLERHHRSVSRLREARDRDRRAGLKGRGERHQLFETIVSEVGIDAARSAWTAAFGKDSQ